MLLDSAPAFKILGAYRVKRESGRGSSAPRPWASFAIRLSGSSRFESEGESISAPEGSVIYIPEGVSFSRRGTDEELVIVHLKLYDTDHKRIEIFEPEDNGVIADSFISLFEQWEACRAGYSHRCSATLYNILAALSSEEVTGADTYKTALIRRGAEMINSDFSSPTATVEAAAAESSVSPEYFRAIYRSVYGISPHRAIEEKRMEKARILLEAGYFSISRVAEECGFQDVKYFSTLFRKRTGLSPREYKKRYNN